MAEGTVGLAVSTLGVVQLPPAVAPGVGESFTEVTVSGRAELAFTLVAVSETAAEIAEKIIFKKSVKNMKTIKFLTSCEIYIIIVKGVELQPYTIIVKGVELQPYTII